MFWIFSMNLQIFWQASIHSLNNIVIVVCAWPRFRATIPCCCWQSKYGCCHLKRFSVALCIRTWTHGASKRVSSQCMNFHESNIHIRSLHTVPGLTHYACDLWCDTHLCTISHAHTPRISLVMITELRNDNWAALHQESLVKSSNLEIIDIFRNVWNDLIFLLTMAIWNWSIGQ